MRKFERKFAVQLGFFSASREPVEMVFDIEPTHEKLELLAEMNKADYIDIITRLVPVEG